MTSGVWRNGIVGHVSFHICPLTFCLFLFSTIFSKFVFYGYFTWRICKKENQFLFLFLFVYSRLRTSEDVSLLEKLEVSKWKVKVMLETAPVIQSISASYKSVRTITLRSWTGYSVSESFLISVMFIATSVLISDQVIVTSVGFYMMQSYLFTRSLSEANSNVVVQKKLLFS
jgi:hypothetical protein